MSTHLAVAVVLVVTLAGGCVQTCTEPSVLPSADSFAGPCGEDHDCIGVPSNQCGHGCDCEVVIATDEQERYGREVQNIELCCTNAEADKLCDCAAVTPACQDGRCVNAAQ